MLLFVFNLCVITMAKVQILFYMQIFMWEIFTQNRNIISGLSRCYRSQSSQSYAIM